MADTNSEEGTLARLEATLTTIERVLEICEAPSISFGVLHDSQVIFRKSFGFRDVEAGLEADSDTSYLIASCSKMITSLALGILVEEGVVSWNDTINKHLPSFNPAADPEISKAATLIDACRHTTGLGNPSTTFLGPEGTFNISGKDHLALVNALPTSNNSGQRFGRWFQYSNAAFGLVAMVIEACSNSSFSSFLRSRLLDPLGLHQTLVTKSDAARCSNLAHPYAKMENGEWRRIKASRRPDESYTAVLGAMGMRSSVNDLLALFAAVMSRFDQERDVRPLGALLNGTTENPLRQIINMWSHWFTRPVKDGFENENKYRLGWRSTTMPSNALGMTSFNHRWIDGGKSFMKYIIGRESPPRKMYGHTGCANGSVATAYLFPESHSAVVALCNGSDWADAAETTSQILIQALFDLKPHVDLVPSVLHSRDLGKKAWDDILADWQRDRDVSKYSGQPTDFIGTYVGLNVSRIHIVPSEHAKAGLALVYGDNIDVRCDMEPYNADALSFLPMKHDELRARGMIDWNYYKVGIFEFMREHDEVVGFWWTWDESDYPGLWVKEQEGMSEEDRSALVARLGGPFRKGEKIQ